MAFYLRNAPFSKSRGRKDTEMHDFTFNELNAFVRRSDAHWSDQAFCNRPISSASPISPFRRICARKIVHFAKKLPTLFLDSAFLDFSAKPAPQRLETLATLALKATASTENSETCPRKARDALSDNRGTLRRAKRQPECRATRKAVARPSCEQGPRVEKPPQRRRLRRRAAART